MVTAKINKKPVLSRSTITIVIAERQRLLREAWCALLKSNSDFEVAGEAETGAEAVQLVQQLKSDVLVVGEIELMSHNQVMVELNKLREVETRMVIISSRNETFEIIPPMSNGASGYVLTSNASADLFEAIRSAGSGECFVSDALRKAALNAAFNRNGSREGPGGHLTVRVKSVLGMAAEGVKNSELARTLGISRRTVESHRASLMQKLGVKTQTELVRYAIRHQIISP